MRILSMIIAAVLVAYFMRQADSDGAADLNDTDGSEGMTEADQSVGSDGAATDGGVQADDGTNGADDPAA